MFVFLFYSFILRNSTQIFCLPYDLFHFCMPAYFRMNTCELLLQNDHLCKFRLNVSPNGKKFDST